MEIIDNTDTNSDSDFTSLMRAHLVTTAKWGNVLCIISFVFIGLMILLALAVSVGLSSEMNFSREDFEVAVVLFVYTLLSLAGLIPVIYLSKFSTGILRGVHTFNRNEMEKAFSNLKSSFKYLGILTIAIIVFNILLIYMLAFADLRSFY